MSILSNIKQFLTNFFGVGDSFKFLGMNYTKDPKVKLNIGDEVIIHPFPNISQATKSYPAKIVAQETNWQIIEKGKAHTITKSELWLIGINENSGWNAGHGAALNQYVFNRLQFVKRG